MSKLEVNTIAPRTGTTFTLGESGDTVNVGGIAGTGFGKILQCLTGNELTSAVTTTSNSFVDSGLYVNITPSSTSSKILISTNMNTRNTTASGGCVTTIYRDSTPLSSSGNIQFQANGNHHSSTFQQFLDTPNTTSQITYKMYFYRFNTGTAHISAEWGGARMFALEVAG